MPTQSLVRLEVRNCILDDLKAIPALLRRVYPPPHGLEAIWPEQKLLQHLSRFPEGQLVVSDSEGGLIASATSLLVPLEWALMPHSWMDITGDGSLSTHDPGGDALYCVNIAVDPRFQNQGVARMLYDARIQLARSLGCRALVAGARLAGYHRVAGIMGPELYVEEVVQGERMDPTLSKQLKLGFEVRGILRDYAPDPETLGNHALIVLWLHNRRVHALHSSYAFPGQAHPGL